ncbi:hypothetical protein OG599_15080 [Streptomyces sp. NBC_01335]|uniref:hypothetical protein n=1 Tax=Streptomyces sp. NBC_01335 TaxID=2903828 RepID=UPI002E1027EF|nr:hypothetical protein OG599_15080 [Streptomyces sp. NBC_01335]
MADELVTSGQLKKLFAKYGEIGASVGRLADDIDRINTLNLTAGGQTDKIAEQYRTQVVEPSQVLTEMVTLLKAISVQVGSNGVDAITILNEAETDAEAVAASWGEL